MENLFLLCMMKQKPDYNDRVPRNFQTQFSMNCKSYNWQDSKYLEGLLGALKLERNCIGKERDGDQNMKMPLHQQDTYSGTHSKDTTKLGWAELVAAASKT